MSHRNGLAGQLLVDSSLFAAVTGITETGAMRDGDLLGRLLETFVVAQFRSQAAVSEHRCTLHHLRQHNGRHEIDVVIELDSGHIIGIEVKATAAPSRGDARHLAWLQSEEDDRFLAGLVLHTGPGIVPIVSAPAKFVIAVASDANRTNAYVFSHDGPHGDYTAAAVDLPSPETA